MSRQVDVKALVSHIVRGDGGDKCRICMGDTTEGQVFLGDTVMLDGNKPVTLAELLETITGVAVEMDFGSLLPQSLCGDCVRLAVVAKNFIENCRKSAEKWTDIPPKLFKLSDGNIKAKTLFAIIENETVTVKNVHKQIEQNPKSALKAFKYKMYSVRAGERRTEKARQMKRNNEQTDIRCPDCDRSFSVNYFLNLHLSGSTIRSCWVCHDIVALEKLKDHFMEHNKEVFSCSICMEVFDSKSKFNTHMKTCHKGTFFCVGCRHSFRTLMSFSVHSSIHEVRVCQGCSKKFTNRKCYLYHRKQCRGTALETEVTNYTCDYCSYSYTNKNSLRVHIKLNHLHGRLHQCHACGKKFSSNAHLVEHQNTHIRILDRFICEFCEVQYSTRRGYERHVIRAHFKCKDEGRMFLRTKSKNRRSQAKMKSVKLE